METHILSNSNPKALNESLKGWLELNWKPQGGICCGYIGDVQAYSILLVRTAKKTVSRMVKPTIEDIINQISTKNLNVDAETFYNHYESNGWKVNNAPMKKWQSALSNWSTRENKVNPIVKEQTPEQQQEATDAIWKKQGFESEKAMNDHYYSEQMKQLN